MSTGNFAGKQSPTRVGAALCVQVLSLVLLLVLQVFALPLAQAETSVLEQLDRIERRGNLQAQASLQELEALQSRVAPGSRELLQLLLLKGNLLIRARQDELLMPLQAQLADWPDAASKPQVNLVSHQLKARRLALLGQLEAAKQELVGLAAYTPPSTPLPLLINAYQLLGRLQSDTGQIELALDSLHTALKFAESSGSSWRRATTRTDLADAYVQAQQFERAEQTMAEALSDVEQDPDPTLLYALHTMRGIVYAELGRIQLAGQAQTRGAEGGSPIGAARSHCAGLGQLRRLSPQARQLPRSLEACRREPAAGAQVKRTGHGVGCSGQYGLGQDCAQAHGRGQT